MPQVDGFQQGIINREQFTQLYHHLVENENVTQLFRKYSSQASKYVQHSGVGREGCKDDAHRHRHRHRHTVTHCVSFPTPVVLPLPPLTSVALVRMILLATHRTALTAKDLQKFFKKEQNQELTAAQCKDIVAKYGKDDAIPINLVRASLNFLSVFFVHCAFPLWRDFIVRGKKDGDKGERVV